jgi:hypothetical protein
VTSFREADTLRAKRATVSRSGDAVSVPPDGSDRSAGSRSQRLLAIAVVGAILLATGAAFVITEKLKLTPAAIFGTRVSKTFSPVCACATDNAAIRFRLRRGGRVQIDVIGASGVLTRPLAHRRFRAGVLSFRWFGHDQTGGLSHDGNYKIEVRLFSEHRTIVLPNTIRLVTVAPRIEQFQPARRSISVGERVRIRYRFNEKAIPILLVDGREAVVGRFAPSAGTIDWFGKVGGQALRAGLHRLELEARDSAGNTSVATPSIGVEIRARARTGAHPRRGSKH